MLISLILVTRAYNHFHNILKVFDVLPNFLFATSETMRDYYLQTWYIRVAKRLKDLRKLGNIKKESKLDRVIA